MNSEIATALLRRLVPDLHTDPNQHLVDDIALLATYKYDDFEMYGPGQRFFEHLFRWLQQFQQNERLEALRFLRNRLIFISRREMQVLTRCVFYDVVVRRVLQHIITAAGLDPFAYAQAYDMYFASHLRRCLFIGLSDSAHIDFQNKPVRKWLSKNKWRGRRGATEGQRYTELAQQLRYAIQQRPAGARDLAELDAAIWRWVHDRGL